MKLKIHPVFHRVQDLFFFMHQSEIYDASIVHHFTGDEAACVQETLFFYIIGNLDCLFLVYGCFIFSLEMKSSQYSPHSAEI